jgi:hypothetical protein
MMMSCSVDQGARRAGVRRRREAAEAAIAIAVSDVSENAKRPRDWPAGAEATS